MNKVHTKRYFKINDGSFQIFEMEQIITPLPIFLGIMGKASGMGKSFEKGFTILMDMETSCLRDWCILQYPTQTFVDVNSFISWQKAVREGFIKFEVPSDV